MAPGLISSSPTEESFPSSSLSSGASSAAVSHNGSMPIAVVGMSFRGPGEATTVENLWKMICDKREGWGPIPKEKWNNDAFYHPDNKRHGTMNVKGGHFFKEDLAVFDAPFFNMTATEAAALDPQQRILLEGTFEALENGGIPLEQIMGSKTSCFTGSFSCDYNDMLLRDPDSVPMHQCTNAGQNRAMFANRVSYFFNMKGPSVTVDTACSGGLVALHLACQSLRTGDATMAVASGVNAVLSHESMNTMSMMKFLSPEGRCYTFDERAGGYARGEGVGCLILKPLVDAIRDNDTIRAVIRGTGSNQDGKTSGITLPNGLAQEELIRDTYATAGLDPLETEYVEAHGTGTQAGDPQETGALSKIFCNGRPADKPLRIGSIKTNIGHLEGASGLAGVVKGIMMLENRSFLPNRNFKYLNPRLPLEEWKLKIQLECEPWNTPGPYRISVNSFGYGGSNAHVILESAEGYLADHGLTGSYRRQKATFTSPTKALTDSEAGAKNVQPRLFQISSFDEASGKRVADKLAEYLEEKGDAADDEFMNDLAYTLGNRRTNFMWKAAVPGTTAANLAEVLKDGVKFSRATKKPTVGFVFTGQGAQWCGMGKELLGVYPVFDATIDKVGAHLKSLGAPFDLIEEMTRDPKGSKINEALYSQPICSAVQIALVDLLTSWGIRPDSVTGHSSGEMAAAYTMGALNWQDAMTAAYYRGVVSTDLAKAQTAKGSMMAVGLGPDEVAPHVAAVQNGKCCVACVNSPSSVTISGDESAIDELKEVLDEKKIFARKLAVAAAYHSHHMQLVGENYRNFISHIKTNNNLPADAPEFFSSVTGEKAAPSELGADYWVANMLGQVKFATSLRQLALETTDVTARSKKVRRRVGAASKASVNLIIEVGPHSALAGPIKQTLKADRVLNAASIAYGSVLVRKSSAVTTALTVAGTLASSGFPLDLVKINTSTKGAIADGMRVLVDLPTYPWNHSNKYWAESRISKAFRNRKFPRTDLLGVQIHHSSPMEPQWRNYIRTSEIPWVQDHQIQGNTVYPAAGYMVMAIEAVSQWSSENVPDKTITGYTLREVEIGAALVIADNTPEVLISLRPHRTNAHGASKTWKEYTIRSVTEDDKWTEHCTGLIRAHYDSDPSTSLTRDGKPSKQVQQILDEAVKNCQTTINVEEFYKDLTQLGLGYGETFANLTSASSSLDTCVAELTIPDTAATTPANFEFPFVIHPATLDSTLHTMFVAAAAERGPLEDPAIPISVDEVFVSPAMTNKANDKLDVYAKTKLKDEANFEASLWASDKATGKMGLYIKGMTCRVLPRDTGAGNDDGRLRVGYNVKWEADPELLSSAQIESLSKTAASSEETVALYLQLLGNKNPHQNVLEVNGGVGATAATILQAVGGKDGSNALLTRYTLADADSTTVDAAKEALSEWADLVKFKQLNIEGDIEEQGFDQNSFDVVVLGSSELLHKSESKVLKNIRSLLKTGGKFIFIDESSEQESTGKALLQAEFSGLEASIRGSTSSAVITQAIGEKPAQAVAADIVVITEQQDNGVSVNKLVAGLESAGAKVEVSSIAEAKPDNRVCIVLSDLTSPVLAKPDAATFDIVKGIFMRSKGLLWVTRGGAGSATDPSAGLVTGFARTVRAETDGGNIVTLDLDGETVLSHDGAADVILKLFQHRLATALETVERDVEYAEKNGVLQVPRLVEDVEVNENLTTVLGQAAPVEQPLHQDGRKLRAMTSAPGQLNTVHFADDDSLQAELPADWIAIEVRASGLGKSDLQLAKGPSSQSSLGFECAGVVYAVGKSVTDFSVGDRVATLGSRAVTNYHQDKASSFQKIPDNLTFEQAAALPLNYSTAYHVVHNLAQANTSTTSVLIHGIAEPTGLAIVELLRLVGVQPLGTVRSSEERDSLVKSTGIPADNIFSYNDASFADEIMWVTKGNGVDVIVDLLGGDEETLRLCWNCIAPYGRFIELGEKDIASNSRLEMANFSKNTLFTSLDIFDLWKVRRSIVDKVWADVMDLVRSGAIQGPASVPVHQVTDIAAALTELDNGTAKQVVLSAPAGIVVKALPEDKSGELFRPDASYLLVGGLGGIGREVASWMIDHGAKNLLFANRSGLDRAESQEVVKDLKAKGATVAVYRCDASVESQVAEMAKKAAQEMPPIRGVIQAAMVLRDTLLEKLSVDDYNLVVQPKFQGTWNLHKYLPRDMDFFTMLSSVSGIIGNATQSAYAAGNTFMDAFATFRNRQGLPAITLDLGAISGVGYLSENKELLAAMEQQGFEATNEKTLMALILTAITKPQRNGVQSQMITGLGKWEEGKSLGNFSEALFAHFRRQSNSGEQGSGDSDADRTQEELRASQSLDEATNVVCTALCAKLAGRLGTDPSNINTAKGLSEYGVDSLVAVELRTWIAKEMASTIPILELLASSSLLQLSTKIASRSTLVKVPETSS